MTVGITMERCDARIHRRSRCRMLQGGSSGGCDTLLAGRCISSHPDEEYHSGLQLLLQIAGSSMDLYNSLDFFDYDCQLNIIIHHQFSWLLRHQYQHHSR